MSALVLPVMVELAIRIDPLDATPNPLPVAVIPTALTAFSAPRPPWLPVETTSFAFILSAASPPLLSWTVIPSTFRLKGNCTADSVSMIAPGPVMRMLPLSKTPPSGPGVPLMMPKYDPEMVWPFIWRRAPRPMYRPTFRSSPGGAAQLLLGGSGHSEVPRHVTIGWSGWKQLGPVQAG